MSLTQFKGYFYLWNAIIKQWWDETKTKNILLVTVIIEVSLEKDLHGYKTVGRLQMHLKVIKKKMYIEN